MSLHHGAGLKADEAFFARAAAPGCDWQAVTEQIAQIG
jgi:hypothetical protein